MSYVSRVDVIFNCLILNVCGIFVSNIMGLCRCTVGDLVGVVWTCGCAFLLWVKGNM